MPPLNDNASYKIQNGVAALKGPEADHWWAAMEPQIESINEKGFSTLPKGFSSHHKKMAPYIQLNSHQSVHCHRARLIATGFNQVAGIDFHKTFSAMLIITSLKTTISVAGPT